MLNQYTIKLHDIDSDAWTHSALEFVIIEGTTETRVDYFSFYPNKDKIGTAETVKGFDQDSTEGNILHMLRAMILPMAYCSGTFKEDRDEYAADKTITTLITVTEEQFNTILSEARSFRAKAERDQLIYSIFPWLGHNCGSLSREILKAGLKTEKGADTLFHLPLAQKLLFLPSHLRDQAQHYTGQTTQPPSNPAWLPITGLVGAATAGLKNFKHVPPRARPALAMGTALMSGAALVMQELSNQR